MPDARAFLPCAFAPSDNDAAFFGQRLLAWFDKNGRHNLPWQQFHKATPDPYAVWISEIMLQQTQVTTVIPYYTRFVARFATAIELADADLDSVLALWAGLGYYARAKNLHKSAQILRDRLLQTGRYPETLDEWQALPGVGRSTAGAIVAMGLGKFGVICDANVQRVLARYFAIKDDINTTESQKRLWDLAARLTPKRRSGHYAQAMMDLGATVCKRKKPLCLQCPLMATCRAHKDGDPESLPKKRQKAAKPTYKSNVYFLHAREKILWLKRASDGVWSNLWCPPLRHNDPRLKYAANEEAAWRIVEGFLGAPFGQSALLHSLSHFHWRLQATHHRLCDDAALRLSADLAEAGVDFCWRNKTAALAKPAAITKLLAHSANDALLPPKETPCKRPRCPTPKTP